MSKAEEPEKKGKGIDIRDLALPQLDGLKKNIEEDIQQLSKNKAALQTAISGYRTSHDVLAQIDEKNAGKRILAPLTSSLYVPASIADTKRVLVEYGAGFYVEESVDEASGFFSRKVEMVSEQMAKFDGAIEQKKKILEQIIMVMQQKIAEISQNSAASNESISGLKLNE